jgi:hypothetical protein
MVDPALTELVQAARAVCYAQAARRVATSWLDANDRLDEALARLQRAVLAYGSATPAGMHHRSHGGPR